MKTLTTLLIALFTLTTFASAATKTLASGKWTKKSHNIEGYWKIIDENGTQKIKLYNFKTKSAPDLKIFLHPKAITQVTAKTATKGAKLIDKLAKAKGNQTYTLPAGVDISKFKSVIIHCQQYTKLWGGSDL